MAQEIPELRRFIDRLGHYFEVHGASRSAGQIFAWMLISEEPQSLDDLVEALQISKGSASLGTRVWERMGLVERVTVPGDRKTYYRLHPQVSERLAEAAIRSYAELVDIVDGVIDHLGDERPTAKANLAAFAAVYRNMVEHIPRLLRQWESEREKE